MVYIGGRCARACKEFDLYRTNGDGKDPANFVESAWMDEKNVGSQGLCYPRRDFFQDLQKMEAMFLEFHAGYSSPYYPHVGVVNGFEDSIQTEFPGYSKVLLARLARTRTMIFVNCLQRSVTDKQFESFRSLRKTHEHKY